MVDTLKLELYLNLMILKMQKAIQESIELFDDQNQAQSIDIIIDDIKMDNPNKSALKKIIGQVSQKLNAFK